MCGRQAHANIKYFSLINIIRFGPVSTSEYQIANVDRAKQQQRRQRKIGIFRSTIANVNANRIAAFIERAPLYTFELLPFVATLGYNWKIHKNRH